MPAYFNLSVQFRRDALYPTFVKDFYTELGACHEDSVYDIQPISKGKKGVLFWRTGTDNE